MDEIRILKSNDDLDDLIHLSHEFFREYEAHHAYFFKVDHLSDGDIKNYFLSFCEHETRKAFIAIEGGKIIGYLTGYIKEQASYWQIKKVGEISGLMVHHEFRHRGIASELIHEAELFFRSTGVNCFTGYTSINNKVALDFYQHLGLTPLYMTFIGEA
jgi:ribosomal protein S18 acetylase RimI-like enzyme